MTSKILLVFLAYALCVYAHAYPNTRGEVVSEDEDDSLTVEDFEAYFVAKRNGLQEFMVKRGGRIGQCTDFNGKICTICNLKIKNINDHRRYIACNAKTRQI